MAKTYVPCSVAACNRPTFSKSYCVSHYSQWNKLGKILAKPLPDRPIKFCTIEGCEKVSYAYGLCAAHNWHRKVNGSPTAGKRVRNGVALKFFQETVLSFHGKECLIWPYTKNEHGYGVMAPHGNKRSMLVHRLACEARHGAPEDPSLQAAHSCGNPACCNPEHTRWDTQKGNEADKLIHGTRHRGEQLKQTKLTAEIVREIRALKGILKTTDIAAKYGINRDYVTALQRRVAWNWLE